MNKKAVCLLSGGLDSCVTTFHAKKQGYQLYALSFNYGQRHKKELDCAKNIASSVNAKKHLICTIDLHQFGGSTLTNTSIEPEKHQTIQDIGTRIPSTYVPARNTIFLSVGLAFAETIDAYRIFIGASTVDYSGYPDCRPEYIKAFQKMANLATRVGVQGRSITIKAPLLYFSKADIIKHGVKLGVPFKKTWSCYLGGEKACGQCESCLLRLKGFKEAGIKDPIKYFYFPPWYLE